MPDVNEEVKTFVKCTRNGADSYSAHAGMSIDDVEDLITDLGGTNIEFVTEEVYLAAVAGQQG